MIQRRSIPEIDEAQLATSVRRALAQHLEHQEAPRAIYLFGSRAAGTSHEGSDLDLAVLCDRPVDPVVLHDAAQDLAVEHRLDVDLVDLRRASTVLATQVIANGRRIDDDGTSTAPRFEAETLADYASLNDRRQPAIDAFLSGIRRR